MNLLKIDLTLVFREHLSLKLISKLFFIKDVKIEGFDKVTLFGVKNHGENETNPSQYDVELEYSVINFNTDDISDIYINLGINKEKEK